VIVERAEVGGGHAGARPPTPNGATSLAPRGWHAEARRALRAER